MKLIILVVLCSVLSFIGVLAETPSAEFPIKKRNIKVERIARKSLRVSWEAPSKSEENGEITHFIVLVHSSAVPEGDYNYLESYFCSRNTYRMKIYYLEENRYYSIVVQALYSNGTKDISDEVRLYLQATPDDPPKFVTCKTLFSEEIRVSWESPSQESLHGVLKGFNVIYAPSYLFDNEQSREHKTVTTNDIVLNGLKKNTDYAITVAATNLAGDGPQSYQTHCRTETDVPDKPLDIKVILYGPENAVMSWHPPLELNGQILHYTIYYRKDVSESKTAEVLTNDTIYRIYDLEPNNTYEFWVTVSNTYGEGPASDYIIKTTSSEIAPQIASYGNTFTVKLNEFVELPCDSVGRPMPRAIWTVNGDSLMDEPLSDRMEIAFNGSLIIKSVIREDANNYTCIAENKFGNDSITHQLIVEAPPKAPEITILNTTTNEIELKLKPNSMDSAPIDGFDLYYRLDSKIWQWNKLAVRVDTESFKIKHCKCGSAYLIYAVGHNNLGDGEASEIITVKTNGSRPSAPEIANFIEPLAESVKLHFGSWNDNSCAISYFFVSFRKKNDSNWIGIREKIKANATHVLNLDPATWYDIRVTAHNAAGSTLTDYKVQTLSLDLATVAPPNENDVSDSKKVIKVMGTN